MAAQPGPKHAITPPKGRPTRSRHDRAPGGLFGSTFQWAAAIGVVALALAILFVTLG